MMLGLTHCLSKPQLEDPCSTDDEASSREEECHETRVPPGQLHDVVSQETHSTSRKGFFRLFSFQRRSKRKASCGESAADNSKQDKDEEDKQMLNSGFTNQGSSTLTTHSSSSVSDHDSSTESNFRIASPQLTWSESTCERDSSAPSGHSIASSKSSGSFVSLMDCDDGASSYSGLRSLPPSASERSDSSAGIEENEALKETDVPSGSPKCRREAEGGRVTEGNEQYGSQLCEHDILEGNLKSCGLKQVYMAGDGNCQFRALADQILGCPEKHPKVRKSIVKQLKRGKDRYAPFVLGSFEEYTREMARNASWGDHVTLQAAADCYKVKIVLITSRTEQFILSIEPYGVNNANSLARLSYYEDSHFNSVEAMDGTELQEPNKITMTFKSFSQS